MTSEESQSFESIEEAISLNTGVPFELQSQDSQLLYLKLEKKYLLKVLKELTIWALDTTPQIMDLNSTLLAVMLIQTQL